MSKIVCRICERRVVRGSKEDTQNGVLFRHAAMRDKQEECDVDGDHVAEPVIVDEEGSKYIWMLRFESAERAKKLWTPRLPWRIHHDNSTVVDANGNVVVECERLEQAQFIVAAANGWKS